MLVFLIDANLAVLRLYFLHRVQNLIYIGFRPDPRARALVLASPDYWGFESNHYEPSSFITADLSICGSSARCSVRSVYNTIQSWRLCKTNQVQPHPLTGTTFVQQLTMVQRLCARGVVLLAYLQRYCWGWFLLVG